MLAGDRGIARTGHAAAARTMAGHAGRHAACGIAATKQLLADIDDALALVKQQIKALEAAQREAVEDGKQPLVAQLAQLRAIGPKGAWVLVKELFGWRRFANRRELAGCLGLAPTPYDSGGSQVEQGISKAGNKRVPKPAAGIIPRVNSSRKIV